MEEANDDFNDDTFGGTSSTTAAVSKSVGKDFDFFGQTAKVSNAITEEQMRYSMQQAPPKSVASIAASPPKRAPKPARTGYEKYRESSNVANLQVDPTLWGTSANHSAVQTQGAGSSTSQLPVTGINLTRKMLSLEEVEAQLRSQAKKPIPSPAIEQEDAARASSNTSYPAQPVIPRPSQAQGHPQHGQYAQPEYPSSVPPQQVPYHYHPQVSQTELPTAFNRDLHLPQPSQPSPQASYEIGESGQPRQILQNPRRNQSQNGSLPAIPTMPAQNRSRMPPGPNTFPHPLPIITHPQQLMHLSEEERAAFLIEDAKRAKRNHKIFLLSKDNGLMTPQDKNFITRIQLQQLMTATGNVNEQDPDAALSEDFYYQVQTQIRGGPRQNPHQPLSHFAQTYLFQTGGRQGGSNRRHNRGGDNHMQRMEQQVQRAVEAAKLKPKNKQLVIEGSLGKISFSNAKTPKPLLNIKRPDHSDGTNRPPSSSGHLATRKVAQTDMSASDRKSILRNIETVYSILMKLEDDLRREPPPTHHDSSEADTTAHMEWAHNMQVLNQRLWNELRVLEPINPDSTVPHPFIAFLSYAKGKKAILRVFRHLSTEQRVMMLTMIVLHLDILDVVRLGQLQPGETQIPAASREAIDLFSAAVTPSLFSYVSEAPLYNVIGLLGLILDRVNVAAVARTRVGLSILTMLTSRATLVREAGGSDEAEWQQWSHFYNRLFDVLEPSLGGIFPGSINSGEDMYVWQFLAAIGSGASPEQQQRLVIGVK